MEDPRVEKEEEESSDTWTQPSQPFPENDYSENETTEKEIKEIGTQTEKSPDFFPTEKSIAKRKKVKYTAMRIKHFPTRVKSINFLSNIAYNSINKADFYNENFILNEFILLVKNLNPFSLQCKISDKFKHKMIYMLWRECVPAAFYRFACQEENLKYINGRDVSQPRVLEIVDENKNNL